MMNPSKKKRKTLTASRLLDSQDKVKALPIISLRRLNRALRRVGVDHQ
jgi:hypothetical protein